MSIVGAILKSRIRRSEQIGNEVSKHNESISSSIVERLTGVRHLKLSATEKREIGLINDFSEKIKIDSYRLTRIRARIELMIDPMVILAGLIILYFSVEVFHMGLAKTGIFVFVLLRLMPYTKDIFNFRQVLAGFSGSLFRVTETLAKAQKASVIDGGPVNEFLLQKGIRFKDVYFSYGSDHDLVLKGVDVLIPADKMTALVGRSGAGKSTLVDLIPRLRVPAEGTITIDDRPIEDFNLRTLRRAIAFVSQEGFLFNDTVENNIRYCRQDASADQIMSAAKMAYADNFIQKFPKGYQTGVGERGVKLSGGQRQRIILARALLQEASIIILDEPTSSLDSESEQFIQKALNRIRAERKITLIVIAHRLSTIKSADQIIVLDNGKVAECGSHGDLVHEDSWYADMARMQAVG
jgi:ABC-type multidrug transport system fused ATPase/permease subunit